MRISAEPPVASGVVGSDGADLARWAGELVAGRAPGRLAAGTSEEVLGYLGERGLAGLAWAAVDGGKAEVRADVVAALRAHAALTAVHAGEALDTARQIREALASEGIPTLLFKGAALVEAGVWTPAERPFSDVDLLLRPRDASRAIAKLHALGLESWMPWREERLAWLSAFTMERPGATAELTVTLDVHWGTRYGDLRQRPRTSADPLWDGADIARGLPSPEGHFAMIADHVVKHLHVLAHLSGLADLVRLLPAVRDGGAIARHASLRDMESRLPRVMDVLEQSFRVPESAFARLPRALRPTGRPIPPALGPERLMAAPSMAGGWGAGLGLRWAMGASPLRDLRDVLLPEAPWLRARYPGLGSRLARRVEHLRRVAAWVVGRSPSPVAPNQEME